MSGQTVIYECFGVENGEKSGVRWHGVLRNVGQDSNGPEGRTSVRCSSFSTSVRRTDFTYVNSSDYCPKNTSFGFAECEETTGTVPSVARRRTFHRRRQLPVPAGCSRQRRGGDLQLRRSKSGW